MVSARAGSSGGGRWLEADGFIPVFCARLDPRVGVVGVDLLGVDLLENYFSSLLECVFDVGALLGAGLEE
jgi:hypothetical protein